MPTTANIFDGKKSNPIAEMTKSSKRDYVLEHYLLLSVKRNHAAQLNTLKINLPILRWMWTVLTQFQHSPSAWMGSVYLHTSNRHNKFLLWDEAPRHIWRTGRK